MLEGKDGLAAAIETVGVSAPPAPAEQLALLPEPALPDVPRTSAPTGGRPAGSRNRRTQEWVNFILGQYQSPLVFLASVYARTPKQLCEDAGLYLYHEGKLVTDKDGNPVPATGDALRMQLAAAKELAPYVHQKLPMAIDVKGKTAGVIVIGELPAADSEAGQALALFARGELEESEEIQPLIEREPQQSDAAEVGNHGK